MPSLTYKSLDQYLTELQSKEDGREKGESIPQNMLLFGEELLYRKALEAIIKSIVPVRQREFSYQPIDGTGEGIINALERVATFSLSPGPQVVVLQDTRVFTSQKEGANLLQKTFQYYQQKDMRRAAKNLLDYMALKGISSQDAANHQWRSELDLPETAKDFQWLDKLLQYGQDHKLKASASSGKARQMLKEAISRGFPAQNYLIMTAETVDKRQSLFKSIQASGLVIDCSVPKGDRRADRKAKEDILLDQMRDILGGAGKTMDPAAFQLLVQMTGFDLPTFCQNLEKLIDYVGRRDAVQKEDITALLRRTKKDPIYELTNAAADRRTAEALFFLRSLLAENYHPLQILAALVNQFRKLLLVKDFVERRLGKNWQGQISFYAFKADIFPKMIEDDRSLLEVKREWQTQQNALENPSATRPTIKQNKKKPKTDLIIVKSPNNPYPVYQLFQKAGKFSAAELRRAYAKLGAVDQRLKSSGDHPRLILEEAILQICDIQAG
jgi:DNA polymerase-3 subunit delta